MYSSGWPLQVVWCTAVVGLYGWCGVQQRLASTGGVVYSSGWPLRVVWCTAVVGLYRWCGVQQWLASTGGVVYSGLLSPQFTFASNAATLIGGCLVNFKYKLRLPAAFISAFVISVSVCM